MTLECGICPHFCQLAPGQTGRCLVRKNIGSKIAVPEHTISLLAVEPIEKRPFFHFYPGSRWLSVGLYGCSFSCDFCQNYKISQVGGGVHKLLSPKRLWEMAIEKQTSGVVFTYNEPTIHYEYLDAVGEYLFTSVPLSPNIMTLAIKTNGFVNLPILREMVTYIDAFNVDIKGDDAEYEATCGGRLAPVKAAIEYLVESGQHLEISYLVLPRLVDDMSYHQEMRDWLSSLNPSLPIHILYCFPFYRMAESYPLEKLISILLFFREKLPYSYISNSFDTKVVGYRDTVCRSCGMVLVDRQNGTTIHKTLCCGENLKGFFPR